ncbi:amidohydrolase family protein [Paucibacter sp. APW11]|uniref:Amidohydrolase family protein n=1 Tax=Roseateles aquae TaxID=3077235 RepID=A0ABU3P8R1_9BURK|nr:amidohydrolase family protein [Paucibacter sp. APW11]MDT8998952.1 amidohydrolase family protein [Paucibacter sp. APW11]
MPLFPSLKRWAAVLLASLAGAALAQPGGDAPLKASAPLTLELRNAQWFDGREFKRGTLYVADGKFTAQKPKRINRRLELRAQFLVAPLAEAHNHNLQNEWGVQNFAQRYLQEGVFYAEMQCGDPDGVNPVRPLLNRPDSPDVAFVTACVTSSDGHPLAVLLGAAPAEGQPALKLADVADRAVLLMDEPADVERKWPLLASRKTDLLKLVLSYHEREELRGQPALHGRLGLSAATASALVRQAHKQGLRVIAQADSLADFELAVQAGVDQIAHLPGYFNHHGDAPERFAITPELASLAARQKTAIITGTAATALFPATPELQAQLRQVQAANLKLLQAAGVPLLLGSDSFMATAQAEVKSLAALDALSPAALLKIATIDTARAIFPKRQLGCFNPGCEASFLVLGGNPLQDLEQLGKPMLRVKQGRILTPLADVAQASDALSENTDTPALKGRKRTAGKTATKATAKSSGKAKSGARMVPRTAAKSASGTRSVKAASAPRH